MENRSNKATDVLNLLFRKYVITASIDMLGQLLGEENVPNMMVLFSL